MIELINSKNQSLKNLGETEKIDTIIIDQMVSTLGDLFKKIFKLKFEFILPRNKENVKDNNRNNNADKSFKNILPLRPDILIDFSQQSMLTFILEDKN